MSGERSAGIGLGADPVLAHARDEEERKTEEQAARWARALLPHLIPQATPAPTPEGWRASDGALTLAKSGSAGPSAELEASGVAQENQQERVIISVKTASHGELSLVLDRSAAGVRVVIGVADPNAVAELASERDALSRQLLGTGLRVESVRVVPQGEVGTVLAPPRMVTRLRASVDRDESQEEAEKIRRRGSRKLNLIG